jgi:hypothetical protein
MFRLVSVAAEGRERLEERVDAVDGIWNEAPLVTVLLAPSSDVASTSAAPASVEPIGVSTLDDEEHSRPTEAKVVSARSAIRQVRTCSAKPDARWIIRPDGIGFLRSHKNVVLVTEGSTLNRDDLVALANERLDAGVVLQIAQKAHAARLDGGDDVAILGAAATARRLQAGTGDKPRRLGIGERLLQSWRSLFQVGDEARGHPFDDDSGLVTLAVQIDRVKERMQLAAHVFGEDDEENFPWHGAHCTPKTPRLAQRVRRCTRAIGLSRL